MSKFFTANTEVMDVHAGTEAGRGVVMVINVLNLSREEIGT